jgi:hypothetical protein
MPEPPTERTVATQTSTDQKLDMTDQRGLSELGKAFDDSFGPRGDTPQAKESPAHKPEKAPARTRADASGTTERATPGHHAPVEIKRSPEPAGDAAEPRNFLGEPEYQAKKRERRADLEFNEDIPLADKKTASFPGRDSKSGKFTKGEKPVQAPDSGQDDEEEKEEADPEVDAISAKPGAHPDVKRGIQTLKGIAKGRAKEIKDLLLSSKTLRAELDAIKKNGLSPEIQKELDRLRATSQRFDLLNDPGFKSRYEDPIDQAGEEILAYCLQLSGGDESIKKWAEETRKFGFKNLSTDYWDKEIIPKIASITNQQRVAKLAADLHQKIDARNRMVTEFTATPDKIAQYNQQKAHEYYTNYASEAQEEANALVAQVGEWAQLKELDKASTDEERALYQEHNNRVEGYKTLFEKTMGDVMHGGPRKHVRIVTQAIYGMDLDRRLKEKTADYEELESAYEALRNQYNKLTRARSIPGRTGGGAEIKSPSGISTKDARSALNDYFAGSGS